MKTFPEMNAIIKEVLRLDGSTNALYAAQRIEELEEETRKLRAVVEAAKEYRQAHLAVDAGTADFTLQHAQVERLTTSAERLDKALDALGVDSK